MKQTKIIMGMPITVEIVGSAKTADIAEVFKYFKSVDNRFSPYKKNSEVSKINNGLEPRKWSLEMRLIVKLCDQTKHQTKGYFNAYRRGQFDPSGLVKGWAIREAARRLVDKGHHNFYIEAGGDIALRGQSGWGRPWRVGIRNPFNIKEIIKVVELDKGAVATSGTYIRGTHIYNPLDDYQPVDEIKSLTVIGPDIYEADRLATAAFAMGQSGLSYIAKQPGLEAYQVNLDSTATFTPGFERFVVSV